MNKPEQAVILCGGLGSRLRPHTNTLPKPMVPCNGKPFLWYLMQQLHEQGIKRFVLLTGYLAEKIEDYFSDGSKFGWDVNYSRGPKEWDTGKRLWQAQELIDDRFLLMYSDNIVPFPYERLWQMHLNNNLPLTFMVSPKSPGNIRLDENGVVEKYDNDRSDSTLNCVEIGYMIVEKASVFEQIECPDCSFSVVLRTMATKGMISGYLQQDAYHSISDPVRWKKTEHYLQNKKIILIDRDGVINKKAPRGEYISCWEDFQWIEDTRSALKTLANNGFKFVVISNQAGINRGMIDPDELERIHVNLIQQCKIDGIDILSIHVCPHHWDEDCDCRKPKPGMFYDASKQWFLRLDKTLFIGDDPRDCQAAFNAGCASVFVGSKEELTQLSELEQPICTTEKLSTSVNKILEYFNNNRYDYH